MKRNMSSIKKIANIWVTPETLDARFPKNCVVECDVLDMRIDDTFPILLKKAEGIQYEVYAKSEKDLAIVKHKLTSI